MGESNDGDSEEWTSQSGVASSGVASSGFANSSGFVVVLRCGEGGYEERSELPLKVKSIY